MSEPVDLAASVLYRDSDVLVIDKPAGIAVHDAPKAGASLEASLDSLRFGLKWRPGLAHRLDRDTSGCLVLGRHPVALRRLNELFAANAVEKTYWAVVEGVPPAAEGVIDRALLKVHRGPQWRMALDPTGQRAVTAWRVLGAGDGRAWLELKPETGRMHQLRVHCAVLGYPVVADRLYGIPARPGERLHLHARAISFEGGRRRVEAVAPPPRSMEAALRVCGWSE